MEAVSSTSSLSFTSREYGHGRPAHTFLPQLRTQDAKEIARRDSITSSRTGDSGYNSDPDFSLSPLDIGPHDLVLYPITSSKDPRSVPAIEPTIFEDEKDNRLVSEQKAHASILLRRLGKSISNKDRPASLIKQSGVTSNPISTTREKSPTFDVHLKSLQSAPKATLLINDKLPSPSRHILGAESVGKWIDESFPRLDRPKERVSSIVSLSSNGSCGDYSITDDSEDDMANMESPLLSRSTIKTIDLIMRKIEINLRYAAYLQTAGGPQSGRRNGSNGGATSSRRGSAQGLNNGGGKRKARNSADDGNLHPEDGDQDDDGPSKRRRVSIATTDESEPSGPRFACPFFKHDPMRYRNRRTCPGPGWPSVHRMKEHLYRSHSQPIYCPRCYTMFDADADLTLHLRSDTEPCQKALVQAIEGIDRNMEATLRRRTTALRPEEDKWRDVYLILFPDTAENDVPSPYYDSDSPTEESRRFRRELLQRIHRELIRTAEQDASGSAEQNLLRRVAGIIQHCENEILNDFYAGSLQTTLPIHTTQPQPQHQPSSNPLPPPPHHPPTPHPNPHTYTNPNPSDPPISPTSHPTVSQDPYILTAPPTSFWTDPIDEMPLPSSGIIDWNTVFPFAGSGGEGMDYDGFADLGSAAGTGARMAGAVFS